MPGRPEEDYDRQAAERQSEDNYVQLSITGDGVMNEVKAVMSEVRAGPDKLMVDSPRYFELLEKLKNDETREKYLEASADEAITGVIISVGPQSEEKVVLFTEGMTVWFKFEKWLEYTKIQGRQVVLLDMFDVLAYC